MGVGVVHRHVRVGSVVGAVRGVDVLVWVVLRVVRRVVPVSCLERAVRESERKRERGRGWWSMWC